MITIKRIERENSSALSAMYRVCQSVGFTNPIEKLKSNWLLSSPETCCYGAYVDDRLIGINMFISHDILIGGVRSKAFQSAWTAVDPEFRDKGIFLRIVLAARKDLLRDGASLVFGFPNSLAEQAYSHKLFRKIPMYRSFIFPVHSKLLQKIQFNAGKFFDEISSENIVKFDQHQNFSWKSKEYSDIVSVEYYTNFIWGRITQQRISPIMSVPALIVGGCEINKPQLLGNALWKAHQQHGVKLVRFTSTVGSLVASSARVGLDGSKTEPLICMALRALPDDLRFDAHIGLKDVF